MEYFFQWTIIAVLSELICVACNPSLLSNLPAGEYKFKFKNVYVCDTHKDSKIFYNYYLHQTSNGSTEIRGNITSKIVFDDTVDMDITMATGSAAKGWNESQFMHKVRNGCSSFKRFMGKAYPVFAKDFGFPNTNCPIPQGEYVSSGFDTANFRDCSFPKTFFYGTYRVRFAHTRKNEIISCTIITLEFSRP